MNARLYIRVQHYKSAAAKAIAQALSEKLGYKVWRSTKEFPKKRAFVYGAGGDKLQQYEYFRTQNIPSLEFTTNPGEAVNWMREGNVVVGRHLLNGSCGNGIELLDPEGYWADDSERGIPGCPVYTKYKKKKREFRVHMFKDNVV